MKQSNKVLLVAGIIGICIILGFLIAARIFIDSVEKNIGYDTLEIKTGSGLVTLEGSDFGFDNFSSINTEYSWDLVIRQGDSYDLTIIIPEELKEYLKVRKEGKTLYLSLQPRLRSFNGTLRAEIVMPMLTELQTSGAASVRIKGFTGKNLEIESSGAFDLKGADSSFEDLSLESSGAANIDLSGVPVKNARIELSGAGNIKLRMNGGELTGALSGACNLVYSGTVSLQQIESSGLSSIRQR